MGKKKRVDVSKQDDVAIQSPFASLQSLRDSLPDAPPPKGDRPGVETETEKAPSPSAAIAGDNDKRAHGPFAMKRAVIRRERAGRGGKTVVKIENTDLDSEQLSRLAKAVKKKLGCGAIVEGDAVVVLGDLEDRVETLLRSEGVRDLVRATKGSRGK